MKINYLAVQNSYLFKLIRLVGTFEEFLRDKGYFLLKN